ncbi:hypothetical protein [Stenotrophomonas oahuensis]|uniref:Lipoprotein n=1 Tax=Stenotrophomonas oahuensis TaxID=3003271 RepID=A0ABY9YU65_9GAMM|nr:hypothetical protein [Stenotrophomonas sp. A5586]WNH54447.1 hypothetical protein PDM29_09290 [Stenotrophomonas sp. A5586]
MNSLKLPLLIAGCLLSASIHAAQDDVDDVGKWLNERTMQAAREDSAPGPASAEREGTYRVIPLAELEAPEEVKQGFRDEIAQSKVKVKRASVGEIPSVAEMTASLPKVVLASEALRSRLRSPPTDLQATLLGTAELIGMEPSGALDGVLHTGLTRFYRLEDIGIVEFNENHFRAPGSTITVIAEMQNLRVNGVPGRLDRIADSQGRSRATLNWAGESKLYTLIATGEGDVQRKAEVLQQIAAAVRD